MDCCCSLGEVAESASSGRWRHVGGRGGGAVVSELVVDGRCLVAFLVSKGEAIAVRL